MEKLTHLLIEAKTGCPIATQDLHVNLKNRQHAIDEYHYGPANPDKPGKYWTDAAKQWKIDISTAKTMQCANCAAFDITDRMYKCMEKGIQGDENNIDAMSTISTADLGYCNFLHFKCAGSRSCSAWVTGGPLVKPKK